VITTNNSQPKKINSQRISLCVNISYFERCITVFAPLNDTRTWLKARK
jgi:hypothetical protein